MLVQRISDNNRPIHQVEHITFDNDVDVISTFKFMKDLVKNLNVRFPKDKTLTEF